MKFYDKSAQPGSNQCSNSSTCPSLCLSTPKGFTCACPDGFSLNASGTACLLKKQVQPATVVCEKGYFRCKNKIKCIDVGFVCDGDQDCDDGSDEQYGTDGPCVRNDKLPCDLEHNFRCDRDRCINREMVCDGIKHCHDNSDESTALCTNETCYANQFQCKKSLR